MCLFKDSHSGPDHWQVVRRTVPLFLGWPQFRDASAMESNEEGLMPGKSAGRSPAVRAPEVVRSEAVRGGVCSPLPWKPGGHTMRACWKGSGRAQIWAVPVCRGMLRWATAAMDAAEGW